MVRRCTAALKEFDVPSLARRGTPVTLFAGLLAWLFAGVILSPQILTYRDAGQFFQHLFHLVQEEWSYSRLPLWNPYVNCGAPLVANCVSSVFYPLKVIFFLPLRFEVLYNAYVLSHLVLAGLFAYLLSRNWRVGAAGATICGTSYAFCGNVLYQYTNVVFLIGAAWLPAALWATDHMLRRQSAEAAIGLGAILAIMVLGGDPQMAYHAGLLAAFYLVCDSCSLKQTSVNDKDACKNTPSTFAATSLHQQTMMAPHQSANLSTSVPASGRMQRLVRRVTLLALALISGLALSAVQILPTYDWSRQSARDRGAIPQNLYDLPAYLRQDPARVVPNVRWYDGLVGKSTDSQSSFNPYGYSFAPWRLAEYLWPWFSGCHRSLDRRWICALEDEADWVPSSYMGILPLLLAMSAWKVRKTDPCTRWISLFVILSLIASFGRFGIGWLVRMCQSGDSAVVLGDGFGGLYWLMTILLPGYSQFRWPSKLLVITAMGLSLLAGFGWERVIHEGRRRLHQLLVAVMALSCLLGLLALCIWPLWKEWLAEVPNSPIRGPFDVVGAHRDLLFSFIHASIICAVIRGLSRFVPRQDSWRYQIAFLAVVVVDLGIANRWMIVAIPSAEWKSQPKFAGLIEQAESRYADVEGGVRQPFRVHVIGTHAVERWSTEPSRERFEELNASAHDLMYPMHHLSSRLELVEATGETFRNYDHEIFLLPLYSQSGPEQVARYMQPRRALDALNVKYFIVPAPGGIGDGYTVGLRRTWSPIPWQSSHPPLVPDGDLLPEAVQLPESYGELRRFQLLYNQDYHPRVHIVHDVLILPPIESSDLDRLTDLSRSIVFPAVPPFDLRATAVVETDDLSPGRLQFAAPANEEKCWITKYEPQRVEIRVQLTQPGLVVLSDLYEENWVVDKVVRTEMEPLRIWRTNRIMRGVMLNPGDHHLVFRYVPAGFYIGAAISTAAWLILAVGVIRVWIRRRAAYACSICPATQETRSTREEPLI